MTTVDNFRNMVADFLVEMKAANRDVAEFRTPDGDLVTGKFKFTDKARVILEQINTEARASDLWQAAKETEGSKRFRASQTTSEKMFLHFLQKVRECDVTDVPSIVTIAILCLPVLHDIVLKEEIAENAKKKL